MGRKIVNWWTCHGVIARVNKDRVASELGKTMELFNNVFNNAFSGKPQRERTRHVGLWT